MKKKDVKLGGIYMMKVSGNIVPVRIQSESPYGGWNGINTLTRREVRIKTAARLRYEIDKANAERYNNRVLEIEREIEGSKAL